VSSTPASSAISNPCEADKAAFRHGRVLTGCVLDRRLGFLVVGFAALTGWVLDLRSRDEHKKSAFCKYSTLSAHPDPLIGGYWMSC
jgi:hypothetical protein